MLNSMSRKANTMASEFNGKSKSLKYLFVAQFADNHRIEQNQEDRSITREGGSQFTDVLAYQEKSKLINFALVGDDCVVEVDLSTGAFFVDGSQPILLGEPLPDEDVINPQNRDYKLIYFRRNYIHHIVPATFKNPKDFKVLDDGRLRVVNSVGEEQIFPPTTRCDVFQNETETLLEVFPTEDSSSTDYYMGWEINILGKTYKQLIRLK